MWWQIIWDIKGLNDGLSIYRTLVYYNNCTIESVLPSFSVYLEVNIVDSKPNVYTFFKWNPANKTHQSASCAWRHLAQLVSRSSILWYSLPIQTSDRSLTQFLSRTLECAAYGEGSRDSLSEAIIFLGLVVYLVITMSVLYQKLTRDINFLNLFIVHTSNFEEMSKKIIELWRVN